MTRWTETVLLKSPGFLKLVLITAIGAICMAGSGCGSDAYPSPDEIIRDVRLDLLRDEVYLMPANKGVHDETVYLPLRQWDIILAGMMQPGLTTGDAPALVSLLIPGEFDHILVYVGKDGAGIAYAVELNTDDIRLEGTQALVTGGHRFICLGKDYGLSPHPTGQQVSDRRFYAIRWAKTFTAEDRHRLNAASGRMMERLRTDILSGYPYQLEFWYSGGNILADRTLHLVDDGLANGAGCADYWTSLFEDYAGVCLKGVRKDAQQIMDYYLNDPVGRTAYLPARLNPLGGGDIPLTTLIELGLTLVDDAPHRFVCDGTEETGLVLPNMISVSPSLRDVEPLH